MPAGVAHDAWHQMWRRLASTLASRGYVVVVPRHVATATPVDQDVALAMGDLEWGRHHWSEAEWTSKDPRLTAVAGHSNGALLAAAIAAKHPGIGAFVSLGGHHEQPDATHNAGMVKAPSFYMWTRSNRLEDIERPVALWLPTFKCRGPMALGRVRRKWGPHLPNIHAAGLT
jgi:pimeloyl-ACP methyl ester carboxylesterase